MVDYEDNGLHRHRTVGNLRNVWDPYNSSKLLRGGPDQDFSWDEEFWATRRGAGHKKHSIASSASTFEEVESLCLSKSSSDSAAAGRYCPVSNGPNARRRYVSRQSSTTSTSTSSGLLPDSASSASERRTSVADSLLESMELLSATANLDVADRECLEKIFQRVLDWNNVGYPVQQGGDSSARPNLYAQSTTSSSISDVRDRRFFPQHRESPITLQRDSPNALQSIHHRDSPNRPPGQGVQSPREPEHPGRRRRRDLIIPDEEDQTPDWMYRPTPNTKRLHHFEKHPGDAFSSLESLRKPNKQLSVESKMSLMSSISSYSADTSPARSFPNVAPAPPAPSPPAPTQQHSKLSTYLPTGLTQQSGSFDNPQTPEPSLVNKPFTPGNAERILMGLGFGAAEGFLPERFLRDWYTKITKAQSEVVHNGVNKADPQDSQTPTSPMETASQPQQNLSRSTERQSSLSWDGPRVPTHKENAKGSSGNSQSDRLKEYIYGLDAQNENPEVREAKMKQFACSRQKSLPLFLETLSEEDEGRSRVSGVDPFDKEAKLHNFINDSVNPCSRSSQSNSENTSSNQSESDSLSSSSEHIKDLRAMQRLLQKHNEFKKSRSEKSLEQRERHYQQSKLSAHRDSSSPQGHEDLPLSLQTQRHRRSSPKSRMSSDRDLSSPKPKKSPRRNMSSPKPTKSPNRDIASPKPKKSPRRDRSSPKTRKSPKQDSYSPGSRTKSPDRVRTPTGESPQNLSDHSFRKVENSKRSCSDSDTNPYPSILPSHHQSSVRSEDHRGLPISTDSMEVADIMQHQQNNTACGFGDRKIKKLVEPAMVSIVLEDVDETPENGGYTPNLQYTTGSERNLNLLLPSSRCSSSSISPIPLSPVTVIEAGGLDNVHDSIDIDEVQTSSLDTDSETKTDGEHISTADWSLQNRRHSSFHKRPLSDNEPRKRLVSLDAPLPPEAQMYIQTKHEMLKEHRNSYHNETHLRSPGFDFEQRRNTPSPSFYSNGHSANSHLLQTPIEYHETIHNNEHEHQHVESHRTSLAVQNTSQQPVTSIGVLQDHKHRAHQAHGHRPCRHRHRHKNHHHHCDGCDHHARHTHSHNHEQTWSVPKTFSDELTSPVRSIKSTTASPEDSLQYPPRGNRVLKSNESSPGSGHSAFRYHPKRLLDLAPRRGGNASEISETDADEFPTNTVVPLLKPRPLSGITKNLYDNSGTDAEPSPYNSTKVSLDTMIGLTSPTLKFSSDCQLSPSTNAPVREKVHSISRAVQAEMYPFSGLRSSQGPLVSQATQCNLQPQNVKVQPKFGSTHFHKSSQTSVPTYEMSSQTTFTPQNPPMFFNSWTGQNQPYPYPVQPTNGWVSHNGQVFQMPFPQVIPGSDMQHPPYMPGYSQGNFPAVPISMIPRQNSNSPPRRDFQVIDETMKLLENELNDLNNRTKARNARPTYSNEQTSEEYNGLGLEFYNSNHTQHGKFMLSMTNARRKARRFQQQKSHSYPILTSGGSLENGPVGTFGGESQKQTQNIASQPSQGAFAQTNRKEVKEMKGCKSDNASSELEEPVTDDGGDQRGAMFRDLQQGMTSYLKLCDGMYDQGVPRSLLCTSGEASPEPSPTTLTCLSPGCGQPGQQGDRRHSVPVTRQDKVDIESLEDPNDRRHTKLSRLKYEQNSHQNSCCSLDIETDFMHAGDVSSDATVGCAQERVNDNPTSLIIPIVIEEPSNSSGQASSTGSPSGPSRLQRSPRITDQETSIESPAFNHSGCPRIDIVDNDVDVNANTCSNNAESVQPNCTNTPRFSFDFDETENQLENHTLTNILRFSSPRSTTSERSPIDMAFSSGNATPNVDLSPFRSFDFACLRVPDDPKGYTMKASFPQLRASPSKDQDQIESRTAQQPSLTTKSQIAIKVTQGNDGAESEECSLNSDLPVSITSHRLALGREDSLRNTGWDKKGGGISHKTLSCESARDSDFLQSSSMGSVTNASFLSSTEMSLDDQSDVSMLPRRSIGSDHVPEKFVTDDLDNSVDVLEDPREYHLWESLLDADLQLVHALKETSMFAGRVEDRESFDIASVKSIMGSDALCLDDMEVLVEMSTALKDDSESSYSDAVFNLSDTESDSSLSSAGQRVQTMVYLQPGSDRDELLQVSDYDGYSPSPSSMLRGSTTDKDSFQPNKDTFRGASPSVEVDQSHNSQVADREPPTIVSVTYADGASSPEKQRDSHDKGSPVNVSPGRSGSKDNWALVQSVLSRPGGAGSEAELSPQQKKRWRSNSCEVMYRHESVRGEEGDNSSDECDREISEINLRKPKRRLFIKMNSDPVDKNLYTKKVEHTTEAESSECQSPPATERNQGQTTNQLREPLFVPMRQAESPSVISMLKVFQNAEFSALTQSPCEAQSADNALSNNCPLIVVDESVEPFNKTWDNYLGEDSTAHDENESTFATAVVLGTEEESSDDNCETKNSMESETLGKAGRSSPDQNPTLMDELQMIALFETVDDLDRMDLGGSSPSSPRRCRLSQISEEETQSEEAASEDNSKGLWQVRSRFITTQDTVDTPLDGITPDLSHSSSDHSLGNFPEGADFQQEQLLSVKEKLVAIATSGFGNLDNRTDSYKGMTHSEHANPRNRSNNATEEKATKKLNRPTQEPTWSVRHSDDLTYLSKTDCSNSIGNVSAKKNDRASFPSPVKTYTTSYSKTSDKAGSVTTSVQVTVGSQFTNRELHRAKSPSTVNGDDESEASFVSTCAFTVRDYKADERSEENPERSNTDNKPVQRSSVERGDSDESEKHFRTQKRTLQTIDSQCITQEELRDQIRKAFLIDSPKMSKSAKRQSTKDATFSGEADSTIRTLSQISTLDSHELKDIDLVDSHTHSEKQGPNVPKQFNVTEPDGKCTTYSYEDEIPEPEFPNALVQDISSKPRPVPAPRQPRDYNSDSGAKSDFNQEIRPSNKSHRRVKVTTMFSQNSKDDPNSPINYCSSTVTSNNSVYTVPAQGNATLSTISTQINVPESLEQRVMKTLTHKGSSVHTRGSLLKLHQLAKIVSPIPSDDELSDVSDCKEASPQSPVELNDQPKAHDKPTNIHKVLDERRKDLSDAELQSALQNQGDVDIRERDQRLGRLSNDDENTASMQQRSLEPTVSSVDSDVKTDTKVFDEKSSHRNVQSSSPSVVVLEPESENSNSQESSTKPTTLGVSDAPNPGLLIENDNHLHALPPTEQQPLDTSHESKRQYYWSVKKPKPKAQFLSPTTAAITVVNDAPSPQPKTSRKVDDSHPELAYLDFLPRITQKETFSGDKILPASQKDKVKSQELLQECPTVVITSSGTDSPMKTHTSDNLQKFGGNRTQEQPSDKTIPKDTLSSSDNEGGGVDRHGASESPEENSQTESSSTSQNKVYEVPRTLVFTPSGQSNRQSSRSMWTLDNNTTETTEDIDSNAGTGNQCSQRERPQNPFIPTGQSGVKDALLASRDSSFDHRDKPLSPSSSVDGSMACAKSLSVTSRDSGFDSRGSPIDVSPPRPLEKKARSISVVSEEETSCSELEEGEEEEDGRLDGQREKGEMGWGGRGRVNIGAQGSSNDGGDDIVLNKISARVISTTTREAMLLKCSQAEALAEDNTT